MIRSSKSYHLLSIMVLWSLIGCNVKDVTKQVELVTSGIYEEMTFVSEAGDDLGEHLISQNPILHKIQLRNNSKYPVTNIELDISNEISADMKFAVDEEGKSLFPGHGGTCLGKLNPGEGCSIMLQYIPRIAGEFKQLLVLNYKNYVDAVKREKYLKVVAGEAASLYFTRETTSYGFGVVERTERMARYDELEIKNGGGLPAKNITITYRNSPEGVAYDLVENSCPAILGIGQSCKIKVSFIPQNYDSSAPDSDQDDLNYTSRVTIEYQRDTAGSQAQLNGYFSTISTSIRGKIVSNGLLNVQFPETIAGNRNSLKIKISNAGYKEAIVRAVHFRDASDTRIATCIKQNEGEELHCLDPSQPIDGAPVIPLSVFPFFVKDLRNCIDTYDKMDYERLPDMTLSKAVRTVNGKDLSGNQGDYCIFDVTFQPSTTVTGPGNFSDIDLIVEYDTTWKNKIDIENSNSGAERNFTITQAKYLSAAKLSASTLDFATSKFFADSDLLEQYDNAFNIGRIALITDVQYRQNMKISVVNLGNTEATIISVHDGKGERIELSSSDLSHYYQQFSHNCELIEADTGSCSLNGFVAPLTKVGAQTLTEAQRLENMYDDTSEKKFKKFVFEYSDGASFNDDMTVRESQQLEVAVLSSLIEKGHLVFGAGQNNSTITTPSGSTKYKSILIKNVGTGTIPYLTFNLDPQYYDATCSIEKQSDLPCKFEIVPSIAQLGAQHDCFDLLSLKSQGPIIPLNPAPGYVPPPLSKPGLAPDSSCSMTFKFSLRANDVIPLSAYEHGTYPELDREYFWDEHDPAETWEYKEYSTGDQLLSLLYLDGDKMPNTDEGYMPLIDGYGNWAKIAGGNNGDITISARYYHPGKIIPGKVFPNISAIAYRPSIEIGTVSPKAGEWGSPRVPSVPSLPPQHYTEVLLGTGFYKMNISNMQLGAQWSRDIDDEDLESEYAFTGGYFPANGSTYNFGLSLCNNGSFSNTIYSISYTPSAPTHDNDQLSVISGTLEGVNVTHSPTVCRPIVFSFKPNGNRNYSGTLQVKYANGIRDVDGNLIEFSKTIRVNAYGATSDSPEATVTEQNYLVEYDSATGTNIETLLPGHVAVTTEYNKAHATDFTQLKAIKGSNSYTKRRYIVTNTGGRPMRKINIGMMLSDDAISDVSVASEYTITANTCQGSTLNVGNACYFDLKYKPTASALNEVTLYFGVRYSLEQAPNNAELYISRIFRAKLLASNPAKMNLFQIAPMNLPGIQGAFGVNMGKYANSTQIVLTTHPTTSKTISNITVKNSNSEKGSFIKQYRDFVGNQNALIPAGAKIKIYQTAKAEVLANRYCFFGDDEFNNSIPYDLKGYSSASTNLCKIEVKYNADGTYAGAEIVAGANVIPLKYYNNERASTDTLHLYISGFVEPNRVTYSTNPGIYDVLSSSSGQVRFSWSAMNVSTPAWGDITGYKVFYGKYLSPFANIYTTTGLASKSISAQPVNTVTITGLTSATYYYFIVAAVRNIPGKGNVISIVNKTPFIIPVPPAKMFWAPENNTLIDTNLMPHSSPIMMTQTQGINACQASKINMSKNGVVKATSKKLINSTLYQLIEDRYISNSNYQFSYVPHWVSDPPIDISTVFGEVYSPLSTTGHIVTADNDYIYYVKPCANDTCKLLPRVLGGDGEEIPPGSTVYISAEAISAGIRCYLNLE